MSLSLRLIKSKHIFESTTAFFTYRPDTTAFEVNVNFFTLLTRQVGLDTEKASGAGPVFGILIAEMAAPVKRIHYASAGLWFSSCLQHGGIHLGVLQKCYIIFFNGSSMRMGRSCPYTSRAWSVWNGCFEQMKSRDVQEGGLYCACRVFKELWLAQSPGAQLCGCILLASCLLQEPHRSPSAAALTPCNSEGSSEDAEIQTWTFWAGHISAVISQLSACAYLCLQDMLGDQNMPFLRR